MNLQSEKATLFTPEQIEIIQRCFRERSWLEIINYVKKETESLSQDPRRLVISEHYHIVFEYALSQKAHAFIENTLLHPQVMRSIDQWSLYDYSKTRQRSFQEEVIVSIVNNPVTGGVGRSAQLDSTLYGCSIDLFYDQLKPEAKRKKSNLDFVKLIIQDPRINDKKRSAYLSQWVASYCTVIFSKPLKRIHDLFYSLLPNKKTALVEILAILINHFHKLKGDDFFKNLIVSFLEKTQFHPDQIYDVFDYEHQNSNFFVLWDTLLSAANPHNPRYSTAKKMSELINLPIDARAQFLLENSSLLSNDRNRHNIISTLLDQQGRKALIREYINNPNFPYGSCLLRYVLGCEDDLLLDYISCAHTQLPDKCLTKIAERFNKTNDPVILIDKLINRSNFVFDESELVVSLFELFTGKHKLSIDLLLKNPLVISYLKQYYAKNSDDHLQIKKRNMLMPSVLAWYIHSDNFLEVFNSYEETVRKRLLKEPVMPIIDPSSPTLSVCIFRSGKTDLIAAIDGMQPRLVKFSGTQPILFIPSFWKNAQVLNLLPKVQRSAAIKYAKTCELKLKETTKSSQSLSTLIAGKAQVQTLTLLHQTNVKNLQDILVAGTIQTRLHLQGHGLRGKRILGLTIQGHPVTLGSAFCYFTRQPNLNHSTAGLSHFVNVQQAERASITLNVAELLLKNPHIDFLVVGPTQFMPVQTLQLPDGQIITTKPWELHEGVGMLQIALQDNANAIELIHQKLYEYVLEQIIDKLEEPLKSIIFEKITGPKSREDINLARALLDLLHLEWRIPGDIKLDIDYVEKIECGNENCDVAALRSIVKQGSEAEILNLIATLKKVGQSPFILHGMLNIAIKRNQTAVVRKILQMQNYCPQPNVIYYPPEVYLIESLVQLILEDLNNDRVYVSYLNNVLTINSILLQNSHVGGAHHAQMPILHCALSIGNFHGKDSLRMLLNDTICLQIDANEKFTTLNAVLNSLLTFELTTLLVCQQNRDYYLKNQGQFHPKTGEGATDSVVALRAQRLFFNNFPYHIEVNCDSLNKSVQITTSIIETVPEIIAAMTHFLDIPADKIIFSGNVITLNISVADLIAAMRREAVFYEGLNVITDEGRIYLANRHQHGLASAGGHHNDKYWCNGIAVGLASEFNLRFINPEDIESVEFIQVTQDRTVIYVIPEASLSLSAQGKFIAARDEFDPGTEVILNLCEMRGKQFYNVMPLTKLCLYQLEKLKEYLLKNFLNEYNKIDLSIDFLVETGPRDSKVPSPTYGRISLNCNNKELPEILMNIIQWHKDEKTAFYYTDESPFEIIKKLKTLQTQPVATNVVRMN